MNPARAFGPDFVDVFFGGHVDWGTYIIAYLIGPIIGGVAAAFAYSFIARLPRNASASRTATRRR